MSNLVTNINGIILGPHPHYVCHNFEKERWIKYDDLCHQTSLSNNSKICIHMLVYSRDVRGQHSEINVPSAPNLSNKLSELNEPYFDGWKPKDVRKGNFDEIIFLKWKLYQLKFQFH